MYDSGSEPFEVHKFMVDGEKTFRQCRIVDGKRVWDMKGVTTTLYHQKEVEDAELSERSRATWNWGRRIGDRP